MGTNKQSVAVRIAGHEYKILSENDPEVLRQIASDVDRAMSRVRDRTGTVDTLDVAVLTCLNFAREIIDLRDARDRSSGVDLQGRISGLSERVEALLGDRYLDPDSTLDGDGDAAGEDVGRSSAGSTESGQTVDLTSLETLRDRSNSAADDSDGIELDAPRAAAGGRERAS